MNTCGKTARPAGEGGQPARRKLDRRPISPRRHGEHGGTEGKIEGARSAPRAHSYIYKVSSAGRAGVEISRVLRAAVVKLFFAAAASRLPKRRKFRQALDKAAGFN